MTMTGTIREVAGAAVGAGCRRRSAGLMLAVLLLAGCPGTAVPPETQTASPARTAAAVPPVPRTKPKPPPLAVATAKDAAASPAVTGPTTGATAGTVAVTGAEVAALPANPMISDPAGRKTPTNLSPDTLVGLDQLQTRRLLGTPAATEEAPPAKVWHYAKGDCTLKVFFFMDMTSSQDFRALSYDLKSSDNVPDVDKRCFAQLLAQGWDVPHD
ncbi:hypothetical protein J2851_000236 [Azospirillum rugosum]|uniref:SmpA / OmlA family protein n=2 Tax=Azospirillum rugosum TaxID=416170 RepID=A0ABS4SD49_9PROT|nr:hypothetical protein [Azospirillum rugosum]